MPKISAPTVAEHRAAQRAALVRAGVEVLLESGIAGTIPRVVCERAGLTRSSFYDYFHSKDDLLVAIAIDAIESWDREIEEALTDVEPGLAQLRAYVDATMRMTADGRHEVAGALREADLSPSSMDDLMRLHDALLRPLIHVLEHLGIEEAQRRAFLVQGMIGAGMELISHGVDERTAADDIYRILVDGLGT
ncbi:TetR/AcrR family transcriptional regulator [Brevibacterium ihuae]|uniref:TetR/AcrR family transcriptional regulator n=1 Tax=Brevibacterium ihuae TaxID=1631743 RepID=UPI000C7758F4|nr:TetR/AcrR family transcriptional regulator [Brevibacterium ihuae]